MPEDRPSSPPVEPGTPFPQPTPTEPRQQFHIGEEFGTAKKNLPPVTIVLIGVAAVVIVALIIAFIQRPHSLATGTIDDVVSVEVPDQNMVMVGIHVSIHNTGEKPYWIRTIEAGLDTDSGNYTDQSAPAVDYDRYFQAFPALKVNAPPPLKRESMIGPNGDMKGMVIVSFPVTPDVFAKRKALRVTIQPYDQPKPLVITKQ
jgi:hypothetical protein